MRSSYSLKCLFLILDGSSEWFATCFRCQGIQIAELLFRYKSIGPTVGLGDWAFLWQSVYSFSKQLVSWLGGSKYERGPSSLWFPPTRARQGKSTLYEIDWQRFGAVAFSSPGSLLFHQLFIIKCLLCLNPHFPSSSLDRSQFHGGLPKWWRPERNRVPPRVNWWECPGHGERTSDTHRKC